MHLDDADLRIIAGLRKSSAGSFRRIADRIGVHPGTLIKRMRRLEKEGVILGYSADIDYEKMGYDFMAAVQVSISKGALIEVQNKIRDFRGVMMVLDVTGDFDSLALVVCKNRAEFSRLVKKILSIPQVERTNTHVVLNVVKDMREFVPE